MDWSDVLAAAIGFAGPMAGLAFWVSRRMKSLGNLIKMQCGLTDQKTRAAEEKMARMAQAN